jgi:glycosyltransferase involved in cell wall biosynthesis
MKSLESRSLDGNKSGSSSSQLAVVPSARKRIAWFTPLEPARGLEETSTCTRAKFSISAYVTNCLLPLLQEQFDITVFSDRESLLPGAKNFLAAYDHHRDNPFDLFFYQLEDHPSCRFIRQMLGVHPGLVWCHHYMLTDFGPEPILNSPYTDVVDLFLGRRAVWPDRDSIYERSDSAADREVALSLMTLFSQQRDLTSMESRRPVSIADSLAAGKQSCAERFETGLDPRSAALRSVYLPLPIEPQAASALNDLEPAKLCSQHTLRIGYCGNAGLEFRSHKVIEALQLLAAEGYPVELHWLLDASCKRAAEDLIAAMDPLGFSYCLYTDRHPERWSEILASGLDLALHPVFSGYVHSSPFIEQSLMAGLPVITNTLGACEFIPDSVVLQVFPGRDEARQIFAAISALFELSPNASGSVDFVVATEAALGLATRAKAFAMESYGVDLIADELASLLTHCSVHPSYKEAGARWSELVCAASHELRKEVEEHWQCSDLGSIDSCSLDSLREHYQELFESSSVL